MEILKIGSLICSKTLTSALENEQILMLPINSSNRKEGEKEKHLSYFGILVEKCNPLGKDGNCYFMGKSSPTNGEEQVVVDGATSMHPDKEGNYGWLAINS